MNEDEIIKNSLIKAISFLRKNKWLSINNSRDYDVLYEGERFPPKQVLSKGYDIIFEEYPEIILPSVKGGIPTNNFLANYGITVIEKLKLSTPADLIAQYKLLVIDGNPGEVYKWKLIKEFKGRPDLSVADFGKEISSINYSNLIFHNGIAVRNHIAKEKPEEYRKAFRRLFDEGIDLADRIILFQKDISSIYKSMGQELQHHHDERSISTFLTYHNPDKYILYKSSFYSLFCRLLGVKRAKKK